MARTNLFEILERQMPRDLGITDVQDDSGAKTVSASDPSPEELLRQVQVGMRGISGIRKTKKAIKTIIECEHWYQLKDQNGQTFTSFGEFAVAPEPYGLDSRGQVNGKNLRNLLLSQGLHGAWLLYLLQEKRSVGRPLKNIACGEGFDDDVYQPTTGSNSIDRRLLQLHKKRSDLSQRLMQREITFKEAEDLAGLNPSKRKSKSVQLTSHSDDSIQPDMVEHTPDCERSAQVRQHVFALGLDKGEELLFTLLLEIDVEKRRKRRRERAATHNALIGTMNRGTTNEPRRTRV